MRVIFSLVCIAWLVIGCDNQQHADLVATDKAHVISDTGEAQSSFITIDFLNEKYFTGYHLAIDESTLSDHPYFSHLDCKNDGYFSVHFVPKNRDLRLFWSRDYYRNTDLNTYDFESDNAKIDALIKPRMDSYHVFSYVVRKNHLNHQSGCTSESIGLNDNAVAEIYLYDKTSHAWKALKTMTADMLPPYADNTFFISQFPDLFPDQSRAKPHGISDLTGEWAVDCGNGLTTLQIDKDKGLLSLHGNAIYITLAVEKPSAGEYALTFSGIATQKEWIDDALKIAESDISKQAVIGRFFPHKNGRARLHWTGLYDTTKRTTIFAGKDFSLIHENNNQNPITLERCS